MYDRPLFYQSLYMLVMNKEICMYKQISNDQAVELILANKDLIIADVRDSESYNAQHIDEAIHLSMEALNEFCESSDKSQPILVYCTHGISSQSVAQLLGEQGFSEVYSLSGGFEEWKTRRVSDK